MNCQLKRSLHQRLWKPKRRYATQRHCHNTIFLLPIFHFDGWSSYTSDVVRTRPRITLNEMIRKMALTQAESGILHVDDHHRHQYHHDEVYDVEHHSWPVSYDILRHKIERYKLRAEVACRECVAHETVRNRRRRDR